MVTCFPAKHRAFSSSAVSTAPARVTRLAVFDYMKHEHQTFESAVSAFKEQNADIVSGREILEVRYFKHMLDASTAPLAAGCQAVCIFVNDSADAEALSILKSQGTQLLALRCTGTDNVDLRAAERLALPVAHVPAYSPHAVAEFAVALALALNRKIVTATIRMRHGNFSLANLVGFNLFGETVGVVGTGQIGRQFAKIMRGFGCTVLCYDKFPSQEVAQWEGCEYVGLDELYQRSRIVSLHCPLTEETRHMINNESLAKMRDGVIIVNTSRGGLVDTPDLIRALKTGKVSAAGLDVYENEKSIFFKDHSDTFVIDDDAYVRLLSLPNVIATGHQAFLTQQALVRIAQVTLDNIWQTVVLGKTGTDIPNRVA
ncbi:D-isomer specific 2-hydroxyacid dehydrogenase [Zopfochytrium polystomum]|nr:D-isomer specific 2-hydroxyacid dehydrogenase [Zopfochytrium polystomum]